ncbi:DUF2877 domain-containing protein [Propionivibrio dicarboxylicus]|uniref:DUF2877 domain-containing protein n=1 Tax=Propionivibrio dicarboxylicus TaxID=83767 RepID=A0A1G8GT03_9RHOO|nr:DUF2877 domain-containing protein [Propionivibrio dicarboxylicus]SDH97502.1 Protein of unknown function [Propionivibrio dicarboxylicus]
MKSNLLLHTCGDRKTVGRVHSVFARGFNIEFPTQLLYVGGDDAPLSAFGLALPVARLRELLAGVRVGDLVVLKAQQLFIYGHDAVMSIDLAELPTVDLSVPAVACGIDAIAASEVYRQLDALGLERSIGLKVGHGFSDADREHLALLCEADKADFAANSRVVAYFAGRGQGLTPSGDDLLLGFTFALMLFGRYADWNRAVAAGVTPKTTTAISVAYVQAMLMGYVAEHLAALAALIDGGDARAVRQCVDAVTQFGHTSGVDTLFGFFLGLKFLTRSF